MRPRRDSRALAAIVLALFFGIASATETDQFSVPRGHRLADLGPHFTAMVYDNLESARRILNERIEESLEGDASEADWWRSPSAAARVVRRQFPQAQLLIEGLESSLHSPEFASAYPGSLCAYKDHATIFSGRTPLDPGWPFTWHISSTIRIGDVHLGTDKIGHFFDKGSILAEHYFQQRAQGLSPQEAEASAIGLGTGDNPILAENAVLGSWSSGVYSNADLACDLSGMLFYQNLALAIEMGGQTWPPMLVLKDGFWELNGHVQRDSDFFTRFITHHFDEALNPSKFRWGLAEAVRKAVRKRGESFLDYYADVNGAWRSRASFDAQLRELETFFGRDYGHSGDWDELVLVSRCAFPADEAGGAFALLREGERDELLAALDADPSAVRLTGRNGETLLHLATRDGDAVQDLLARGADPDATDEAGRTPLHWAARYGNGDAVERLLGAGADPSARDHKGRTPLHDAAMSEQPERAVALLVDAGAEVDAVDRAACTPLHAAARTGHAPAVAALADRGADTGARDGFGWTAAHHAASRGFASALRELADAGADPDAGDFGGTRPAHLAARAGKPTALGLIAELGGDLAGANDLGATPLHEAAQAGDAAMVELLVRAGAPIDERNIVGRTPAEIALAFGHHDASNVLRLARLNRLELLDTIRRFGE